MRLGHTLGAALALAFAAGGCATADPDVVCTANWIERRTDRAVAELTRDTRGAVGALLEVGEAYASGDGPGVFSLLRLRGALDALESELTEGRGVRDLRLLARTCDEPELVARGLGRWLDAQGLPSAVRDLVEGTDWLERLSGERAG